MFFHRSPLLATIIVVASVAPQAHANLFGFDGVTNIDPTNTAIGIAQFSFDVTAVGSNQVSFRFYNSGPAPCAITQVFFQDAGLIGAASITNMPGVTFRENPRVSNLPGG